MNLDAYDYLLTAISCAVCAGEVTYRSAMPRLARPVPRDHRSRHQAPFTHALKACSHKFISFAAVNFPSSFPDPLNNLRLDLDLPWAVGFDEPAVSRRRLRTVREFFKYTDEEGASSVKVL